METINNKANRVSLIKVKIILSNHILHYYIYNPMYHSIHKRL